MAPAGDFQAAYQALEQGADAVYLGLQNYSARKSAKNFSEDELRRLRTYACERGRSIYITLNTIIRDDEISDIVEMLHILSLIKVDGIIIQDLGLAYIIRTYFPSLSLHGSTQLAVHNVSGVNYLHSIGFDRVVLARELTIKEISHIRRECPAVELEVFIHGALCYGFSGLCLASSTLLNRSANRGACGQICRTWSTLIEEDGGPVTVQDKNGFFFSMKDLALEEHVILLQKMGIEALKIEGRMKSPAFTANTTRLYRDILDRHPADSTPSRIAFSREQTSGWSFGFQRPAPPQNTHRLVTTSYPGHTGAAAGFIHESHKKRILLESYVRLSIRDGLLLLRADHTHPGLSEAKAFSLTDMTDIQGRRITTAEPGKRIWIAIPVTYSDGDTLHKISCHDQDLPIFNPTSIAPCRYQLEAIVTLTSATCCIETSIPALNWTFSQTEPVTIHHARNPRSVTSILQKQFGTSNDMIPIEISSIRVKNISGLSDTGIFIQPKELKQLRHRIYKGIEQDLRQHIQMRSRTAAAQQVQDIIYPDYPLPKRSQIKDRGSYIEGSWYLPLDPIQFNENRYFTQIDEQIRKIREHEPDCRIVVGINNVGQIPWYREKRDLFCYIDTYLYCANRFTAQALSLELPGCLGAYYWMEDTKAPSDFPLTAWRIPISVVDTAYHPPLFISRTCFRHDSINKPCSTCGVRRHTYSLSQKGRIYRVEVRDCMTYVYLGDQKRP